MNSPRNLPLKLQPSLCRGHTPCLWVNLHRGPQRPAEAFKDGLDDVVRVAAIEKHYMQIHCRIIRQGSEKIFKKRYTETLY